MANRPQTTAAKLRSVVDAGYADDKVAAVDPAAAPLGTDDEAGGNSPSREQVGAAIHAEVHRRRHGQSRRFSTVGVIGAIAIGLIIGGVVAAAVWSTSL